MARSQRFGTVILASGAIILVFSCAGPMPRDAAWSETRVPLSTSAILAPAPPHADAELARLERLDEDPAAVLRRAWILLQRLETRHSLNLTNQVLYGRSPLSPTEEALALYLRAEAHQALDEGQAAARDRARALELALDGELRERLLAAEPKPEPAAPGPARRPPSLVILPRSAWQARPERRSRMEPMGRIYRLTIHHSGMNLDSTSTARAADAIHQIQRNDLRKQDPTWGDIGYHFVIDRAGRIWQARDIRWQGAHAGNHTDNRGNVGICLLGNFVAGGQTPSAGQLRALRAFTAQLCRQYRIPVQQIFTHQEWKATDCPGAWLQAQVDQMRREMSELAQQTGKE